MKVLVCGSRHWVKLVSIRRELERLPRDTILVHGACRGADNTAAFVAELLGFSIRPYPADWERFGRRAGILRNQQMLDAEHLLDEPIDLALAFHKDPDLGVGTADMARRIRSASPEIEFKHFRC